MKKIRKWLSRLSLSQQLFAIIIVFVGFFAAFFFLYISSTINKYVDEQMFSTIQSYQSNISFFYRQGMDLESLIHNENGDVVTLYYELEDGEISNVVYDENANISNALLSQLDTKVTVYAHTYDAGKFADKDSDNTFNSGNYTYYSIIQLDDHTIMVNLLRHSYAEAFRSNLLSNIVDVSVIVISIFFIVLMLWVASIIHPLNQIRTYIEKVKQGKDATLKISRQDEIGELAHALVNMREELEKQEKTKQEMIHNISHDLKTPIATIKSYGESIKDGIYPYDTLEKSVDVIIENAERLEKKVHSLLFLNRIEYLVSTEDKDAMVDMKEVVKTVVLNTKVIRPEIEIETNLESSYFRGGEEAWRGAVENILENGLRYANSYIVITLDEKQLCIYNDGPQIKEEKLGSLFKAFEKGEGGQFGIGLSIVYKVVTANKYRVVAENVETGGVIFKIMK